MMMIARAAKGAALLLLVVFGVAALIGCTAAPGAAGAKGAAGPAGPQGPTGPRGPAGPDGFYGLEAKDEGATQLILINNVGAGTTPDKLGDLGDLANPSFGSLDASTFFTGGMPPITYAGRGLPDSGTFQAAVAPDGMITLSKRDPSQTAPSPLPPVAQWRSSVDYKDGAAFTIRATDANGVVVDRDVVVKANKPPLRCGNVPICPDNRVSLREPASLPSWPASGFYLNFVVGTQEKLEVNTGQRTIAAKPAWNRAWYDARQDQGIRVYPHRPDSYYFHDDDGDQVTVAITEIDAEGTADDNEHVMAELEADTGDLTITGLKSTYEAATDTTPARHQPVRIEITATDPGGLTATTRLFVWVDGAPEEATEGGVLQDNYVVSRAGGAKDIVNEVASFFVDPEGRTITPLTDGDVNSSAPLIATAAIVSGNLQVTPVNLGTATITLYATSPRSPGPRHTNVDTNFVDYNDDGRIDSADGDDGELPGLQYGTATIQVTVVP